MLIKNLSNIKHNDRQVLGKYYTMEVDNFMSIISSYIDKGIRINKRLKQIYDEILTEIPPEDMEKKEPIEEIDPILLELESIPIEFLEHYIEHSEYRGNINKISAYTKNLRMLLENPLKGNSKLKSVETAKKWRKLVEFEILSLIADWKDLNQIKSLPTNINGSVSFTENLKNAIINLAHVVKKRKSDSRYKVTQTDLLLCDILLLAYGNGLEDNEIAKVVTDKKDYTAWRIKDLRKGFVRKLLTGKVVYQNLKLSDFLVETCNSLQLECVFHSLDKFDCFSGSRDMTFANIMGFDVAEFGQCEFVVPIDKKGIYEKVGSATIDTLKEVLFPEEVNTIVEKVCEHPKVSSLDFSPDFIKNILYYDKLTEVLDDGSIMIKDKYLTNDKHRMYRIIYKNAPKRLATEEIKNLYEAQYGKMPKSSPKQSIEFNISFDGKKWYYGEPKRLIKLAISDFVEEKIIFHMSELEEELLAEGYSSFVSIRNKVTEICSVDNNDSNHFCHKDFVSDYPSFSWRNPSKYGQSNWIANEVKKLIDNKDGIEFDVALKEIIKKATGTDYEDVARKRGKYIILDFCGDDKPFIIKGNNLSKNAEVFEKTDFSVLGLRKGKNIYLNQIRSIAFNEVKRSEDGKMLLTDIVRVVNEIIDEDIRRNVVVRAIEDKEQRFKKIEIELQTIDGNKYVVWTGQQIVEEPTYEIVATETETDAKQVREIASTEIRPGIKYRTQVDWAALEKTLIHELSYYQRWMNMEDYDLNSSINKFLKFLYNSENSNLSKRLPQNLYEYWYAANDSYDRHTYLTNLTLFFEALLAEIYYQQNGVRLRKKGLSDWAEEFAGLPQKLLCNRYSRGFDRIASDLHHKRNCIAHGDKIVLTSRETAEKIADYVALYVYVLAKYN